MEAAAGELEIYVENTGDRGTNGAAVATKVVAFTELLSPPFVLKSTLEAFAG